MFVVCGLGVCLCFLLFQKLTAQNLIPNPDFGHVIVWHDQGRKVQPGNWHSLNEKFPLFTHQTRRASGAYPPEPGVAQGGYGVFFMHIGHVNDGIYTALKDSLVEGQMYRIRLRVKTHDVPDLSASLEVVIGEKGDTAYLSRLVANQSLLSFIVRLHNHTPACLIHSNDSVMLVDFPNGLKAEHPHWIEIGTEYKAAGKEKYISIGLCFNDDYFEVLREYKSDTISEDNWHTRYLLSNVVMEPIMFPDERNLHFIHLLDDEPTELENVKLPEFFLLDNLTFKFDCYDLNEGSQNELRYLANWLLENPLYYMTITGHTDTTGTSAYNQVLSENRARAVYDFLVENGVVQNRLNWKGEGETVPLSSDYLKKNNGVHRRVEFTLFK